MPHSDDDSTPPSPLISEDVDREDEVVRLQSRVKDLESELQKRDSVKRMSSPPGTDAVLTTLRAYYRVFTSHNNFVERWSKQANNPRTLQLRQSLRDFAKRTFDEFRDLYTDFIPDMEAALAPLQKSPKPTATKKKKGAEAREVKMKEQMLQETQQKLRKREREEEEEEEDAPKAKRQRRGTFRRP